MAKAGYDPQDMVDFFEVLRAKQAHDPGKVEQFFSSHPAPQDRAARIRNEMAMLAIRPTAPVGRFQQTKATLLSMPAARSTQQLSQNRPAPPPPPPRGTAGPRHGIGLRPRRSVRSSRATGSSASSIRRISPRIR
jgi:predicted Zn-dependent protease